MAAAVLLAPDLCWFLSGLGCLCLLMATDNQSTLFLQLVLHMVVQSKLRSAANPPACVQRVDAGSPHLLVLIICCCCLLFVRSDLVLLGCWVGLIGSLCGLRCCSIELVLAGLLCGPRQFCVCCLLLTGGNLLHGDVCKALAGSGCFLRCIFHVLVLHEAHTVKRRGKQCWDWQA